MRLGLDITPLTRRPSGVGTYVRQVLAHLPPLLAPGDALLGWATGLHAPWGAPPEMRVRHLPLPTRAVYACWSAAGFPCPEALLGGLDVFHATNYFLPPVRRARRVLTIYDLAFLVEPRWASPKVVDLFARRVPDFAARADAVITCSEHSRNDIVRLCGVPADKVFVAHGAPDPALAPVERGAARARAAELFGFDAPYVLHVGTVEPRKNLETLLRAFAQACKGRPHRLVLVGAPGWGMDAFHAAAARENLGDRLVMTGYLPRREDLAAVYSAADLFVLPSHYEGFGLPLAEAMACGCPAVASESSCLPEVGGEAALYFPPTDADALAARISEVLDTPELAARLRAQGPAQAARFTWAEAARRTLDVYRRLAP